MNLYFQHRRNQHRWILNLKKKNVNQTYNNNNFVKIAMTNQIQSRNWKYGSIPSNFRFLFKQPSFLSSEKIIFSSFVSPLFCTDAIISSFSFFSSLPAPSLTPKQTRRNIRYKNRGKKKRGEDKNRARSPRPEILENTGKITGRLGVKAVRKDHRASNRFDPADEQRNFPMKNSFSRACCEIPCCNLHKSRPPTKTNDSFRSL